MNIKPNKCRVMKIEPLNKLLDKILVLNGKIIPNVDKYLYLGIEFDNKLYIRAMERFRIGIERAALALLVFIIRNITASLEYRLMFIKSISISTLTYRCESLRWNKKYWFVKTNIRQQFKKYKQETEIQ